MPLAYPRPFLLARAFQPLNPVGSTPIDLQLPASADAWLRGWTAVYQTAVEESVQLSPDLLFRLFVGGREVTEDQTVIRTVTTPAGGMFIRGIMPQLCRVPALSVIRLIVYGQAAGPSPATISVTHLLHKTWEAY